MKKRVKSAYTAKAACVLLFFTAASCSFDYGDMGSQDSSLPDLVMENVEYVRVRSADPVARIYARRVERYETQGLMILESFSFEQYGDSGEAINVTGSAGYALVEIESGDISMDKGVRIEVESEDLIIETDQMDWIDSERIITSGKGDDVYIIQQDGTSFKGVGLRMDARRRSWEFSGAVSGIYYYEDNDEPAENR